MVRVSASAPAITNRGPSSQIRPYAALHLILFRSRFGNILIYESKIDSLIQVDAKKNPLNKHSQLSYLIPSGKLINGIEKSAPTKEYKILRAQCMLPIL